MSVPFEVAVKVWSEIAETQQSKNVCGRLRQQEIIHGRHRNDAASGFQEASLFFQLSSPMLTTLCSPSSTRCYLSSPRLPGFVFLSQIRCSIHFVFCFYFSWYLFGLWENFELTDASVYLFYWKREWRFGIPQPNGGFFFGFFFFFIILKNGIVIVLLMLGDWDYVV